MTDKIWRRKGVGSLLLTVGVALSLSSCIDEDLSDCGVDYKINYTVLQRTNLQTEINSQLSSTAGEQAFGTQLYSALSGVFTDRAQDLAMSFYSNNVLEHSELNTVNASSASFTIYLPILEYRHLAVANADAETVVALSGTDSPLTYSIDQPATDTIATHTVGLFAGRLPMTIENTSQEFNVNLYMQNCAVALYIDRNGYTATSISAYTTGMATSYAVSDSTYSFTRSQQVVRNTFISADSYYGFYAASLPSADSTTDTESGIWQITVYATMPSGSTTRSVLHVSAPLQAGALKVITARLTEDGRIVTQASDVGVSVTLDWKPGGSHDVDV